MMVIAAMVEPQKAARNTGASGPVQGWKKPGFKKNQPSGFFCFVFCFFIFLGFFFIYICPEERVFWVPYYFFCK
jgi:hypothetical protein